MAGMKVPWLTKSPAKDTRKETPLDVEQTESRSPISDPAAVEVLSNIESRILWLATSIVYHANTVRPNSSAEADGWAEAYGVKPGGAVLIRPDGHVAWRSVDAVEDARGELYDVLSIILHRLQKPVRYR